MTCQHAFGVSTFYILICLVSSKNDLNDLNFDSYHDYYNLTDFLQAYAEQHPQLTRLHSIGISVQKRELWVMELYGHMADFHSNSMPKLGIPHVKIIGNIHGNEPAGREVILHMVEHLVKKYEEGDNYIQWLVNNTRISLMPSLNPDGFEKATEGRCGYSIKGRTNSRGLDLNRNFPDYFKRNSIPVQPETEAMKAWLFNNTFVLSASLHGGSMVANYPFDNTGENSFLPSESPTPDDDIFQYLAKLYARTHPTMHKGIPCEKDAKSFKDGVANGASWYTVTGGMQDYNYFKHGCMELTLEISCCKYPPAKQLIQLWNDNLPALLAYISQSQRGVRGVVRDKRGRPVSKAVMMILGRNMTFNTSRDGEFWRVLLPGPYYLQVTADGYQVLEKPFLVPKVENELMPTHIWLDLTLEPLVKNSGTITKAVSPEEPTSSSATTEIMTETTPTVLVKAFNEANYETETGYDYDGGAGASTSTGNLCLPIGMFLMVSAACTLVLTKVSLV